MRFVERPFLKSSTTTQDEVVRRMHKQTTKKKAQKTCRRKEEHAWDGDNDFQLFFTQKFDPVNNGTTPFLAILFSLLVVHHLVVE